MRFADIQGFSDLLSRSNDPEDAINLLPGEAEDDGGYMQLSGELGRIAGGASFDLGKPWIPSDLRGDQEGTIKGYNGENPALRDALLRRKVRATGAELPSFGRPGGGV